MVPQKDGGTSVQPIVTTEGNSTGGSSPGEVGGVTAKGRMESRESWSLWQHQKGCIWPHGPGRILGWQMQALATV